MSQYGADGYAQHGEDDRFILAHYYQGTAIGQTEPEPARPGADRRRAGQRSAAPPPPAGTALSPSATYTVDAHDRRQAPAERRSRPDRRHRAPPLTVTGAGAAARAGTGTYRGSLQFDPDGHGGVLTVDVVGLDDYVRGVVAAEMPASWPAAALQAQAIAARTYAITTGVGAADYDLYDDTRSQMYGGVSAETAATDAAVAATSGQIVTYDGRPAVTYFFASSGGHTESIQNVWAGATPEPWLTGVPDPYDAAGGDPYHAWGSQMSIGGRAAQAGVARARRP